MTTNSKAAAGTKPAAAESPAPAESAALAQVQQWLARHGIDPPEPAPSVGAGSATRRRPRGSGRPRASGRRSGLEPTEPVGAAGPGPADQAAHEPPEDPESVARTVVFRKLAAQARTRHELDRALRAKDIPDAVAAQVLDRMEEVGLVDDAAFARDWVDSRQQRRQLSRRALRHELEGKGVDRDDIDEALQAVDSDDEYAAARLLAERKIHSMRGLARDVRYRRLMGVLARRGFNGGLSARVIAEVLAEDPA